MTYSPPLGPLRLPVLVFLTTALLMAALPAGIAAGEDPPTATLTTFASGSQNLTVTNSSCTDASLTFALPWNATVTSAMVNATLADASLLAPVAFLNASLTATGTGVAANLTLLLGATTTLDLNATAVNQARALAGGSSGNVNTTVDVQLCSPLGPYTVVFDALRVSYWINASLLQPPTTLPLPTSIVFRINGQASADFIEGTAFNFSADTAAHDLAQYNITWRNNGAIVGYGPALPPLALGAGEHILSITVANATSSREFAYPITVAARATLPGGGWLTPLVIGLVAVGAIGMAVASTDAGRYLLFSSSSSVFARLKKASLLDHFVRGTLYQVIRENPGIHFAEVRRRAQIANGVASHHLRQLEKGGYIKVVIDGTKTKFYTTERPLEAEVYGISDTEKAILSAVTDAPGIGQGELAAKLSKSNSAISRAVTKLVALGYVTTQHDGARILVFPRAGADVADPLAAPWPDEGA